MSRRAASPTRDLEALSNPYTGVLSGLSPIPHRPHDPAIIALGGVGLGEQLSDRPASGGCGWSYDVALAAALGETIERMDVRPSPLEQQVLARADRWPTGRSTKGVPVAPESFVRFAPAQHRLPEFPFEPLTSATELRWLRCRRLTTGSPMWVPAEMVWLDLRHDASQPRFGPMISSGLAAGPDLSSAMFSGLRELVERDAIVGAWWGAYPVERWSTDETLARWSLQAGRPVSDVVRPNLTYRFYRVGSPWSDQVVLATVEGHDDEGFIFSFGAACGASLGAAIDKALLEALQGRMYVRYLRATEPPATMPKSFAEHATYYSHFPRALQQTPLASAVERPVPQDDVPTTLMSLAARVDASSPVLFRVVTPRGIAARFPRWVVVRVIAPGLQPLHGHHGLPFLGGPLWNSRPLSDYDAILPHPLP